MNNNVMAKIFFIKRRFLKISLNIYIKLLDNLFNRSIDFKSLEFVAQIPSYEIDYSLIFRLSP